MGLVIYGFKLVLLPDNGSDVLSSTSVDQQDPCHTLSLCHTTFKDRIAKIINQIIIKYGFGLNFSTKLLENFNLSLSMNQFTDTVISLHHHSKVLTKSMCRGCSATQYML